MSLTTERYAEVDTKLQKIEQYLKKLAAEIDDVLILVRLRQGSSQAIRLVLYPEDIPTSHTT